MEPGNNCSGPDQKTLQPYTATNNRFLGNEHKKQGEYRVTNCFIRSLENSDLGKDVIFEP